MLVLRFTCRVLLVLVMMESVRSDRAAPFLIAENMWPRGCVLDCQRGRHRAVCGSNGRLYKSLCAFQRAQCINAQLRPAPRARCSDPGLSKCQLAQSQAREAQNGGGHVSPAAAIFVPQCHPDGHFLPVQCHDQTGYCWCSTPDGEPISGSSVFHLIPDCAEHIPKFAQFTDGDSAPIHDEAGEPATTVNPRKSAVLTAPPFWVTIQMNSDPKGARSLRRPTDGSQTCEHERASLFSQLRSVWQEERFIPECTGDGRYNPVQCHAATGYCWCVRVDSGRPLPGTSARNRIPDCSGVEEQQHREKPLPGCPGARKKQFLRSLVRALQQEAQHAASLKLPSNSPTSSSPAVGSPTSTSTVLDVASPPPALDPEESSRPEAVLQWHFRQLDVDSSGVLSEREARRLRQFLRRRLKPRRCAKKFAQHCDRDGDRGLALEELRVCLGV